MRTNVIHFLGPVETFTEQAAKDFAWQLGGTFELIPHRTLVQTISEATANQQLAVVPYYNLLEGLIQESLDLVFEHQLGIWAARQIPVQFALGGFEKQPVDSNSTELVVYSHPKALAQCSAFLQTHYPNALQWETSSTAQAVQQIGREKFGLAIARREAFEKLEIPVLHDDIGNRQYSRHNYTEFLLAGTTDDTSAELKRQLPVSNASRTILAIIPTVDRVGLLAEILGQIAFFGINLLKIHSRPALINIDGLTPQMFYLETDVSTNAPEFQLCMATLNMRLSRQGETGEAVRLLGTYCLF